MRPLLLCILTLVFAGSCSAPGGGTTNNTPNNTNNSNNINNTTPDGGVDGDVQGDADPDGDVTDPPCDYSDPLASPPAFTFPPEESWNHSIISGSTAASGSPYHMIHDEMVTPTESIPIRAKFDYNAVLHKDLQDEWVILYLWGSGMTQWQELGRFLTDSDGMVTTTLDPLPTGKYILKAVVAGDLTVGHGHITVLESGRRVVVFDIDGTITTSDSEVMQDWANFSTAEMYPYADLVVNYHLEKGYQIVMVTGRPYWLARDTRAWLAGLGIPSSSVRFTSDNGTTVSGQETQLYKTTYLDDLISRCGVSIIRAYGNAETDIGAYADVGVPKTETFIIGEFAGNEGTQAVICEGCGYEDHYTNLLLNEELECGLPQ